MENSKKNLNFIVNTEIYPAEAIISASYMFLDKLYIHLDSPAKNKIAVSMKAKKSADDKKMQEFKSRFFNELLHSTARIYTGKRNKKIREFIVGRALFSGVEDLCPEEGADDGNYQDDPLGIAVPWEEKFKK